MTITIDSAGRVVVPKAIRDRLGLSGGEQIEVSERDGVILLSPRSTQVRLTETSNGLAAVPEQDLPPLTDDLVRNTLDRTRR